MDSEHKTPQVKHIEVGPEDTGIRLDNYLAKHMKKLPKSRLYRAIRQGEVRVNKKRSKPSSRLQARDLVRIPPISFTQPDAPTFVSPGLQAALNSAVLFENDQLIVLNKPAGMAVHGGSGLSIGVIEALRLMRPQERYLELAHRLDKGTSGCLMIAKKRSVLRALHEMIREGQLKKIYHVIVAGHWPKHLQKVTLPLRKFHMQSGERMVMVDHETGKACETLFKPIAYYDDVTHIEARLITGRTHQIRVHCAQSGHAVANDEKYGKKNINAMLAQKGHKRMGLHAVHIAFNCEAIDLSLAIDAPLPKALSSMLSEKVV